MLIFNEAFVKVGGISTSSFHEPASVLGKLLYCENEKKTIDLD